MRKLCVKKNTIAAIAILLIAAVSFAFMPNAARNAHAEATAIKASAVKHDTICKYRYFEYPTAIYAFGDGFAVADGSTLYYFDDKGEENESRRGAVPDRTEKLYVSESGTITLAGGKLTVFGSEISDYAVTDFTVLGNILYAAVKDSDVLYGLDLSKDEPAASVLSDDGEETDPDVTEEPDPTDPDEPDPDEPDPDEPDPEPVAPSLTAEPNFTPMGKTVKRVSSAGGKVYFTVESSDLKYYDDVYEYDAVKTQIYVKNSPEVLDMAATVRLTREGVVGTTENGGTLSLRCPDAVKISVAHGEAYAITDKGGVFRLSDDFTLRTDLLASAHGEVGFFFANAGISSRANGIAVADEFNDRVQILTDDGTGVLDGNYTRPTAVASDDSGKTYVAHSVNKISVHSDNSVKEFVSPDSTTITDLKADIDGNLFVMHDSGKLYFAAPDGDGYEFVEWFADVTAITASQNNDAVFVLSSDGDVLRVTYDGNVHEETTVLSGISSTIDFCTDHAENLYLLTYGGNIERYAKSNDGSYSLTDEFTVEGLVKATKIAMNAMKSENLGLETGDLLISDTGAHAVKSVSGEICKVKNTYDAESDDPVTDGNLNEYDEERKHTNIIFTVSACHVYENEARTKITDDLGDGMNVIIPNYDPEYKGCFFVIADNLPGGKFGKAVTGYIHYTAIKRDSDGKEVQPKYLEPPMTYCYPYAQETVIYEYPTVHCTTKTAVGKDTELTLLDFPYYKDGTLYGYADNFASPSIWYRVCYTGGDGKVYEGYVTRELIQLGNTPPNERNIYPRTNATVISKDKHSPNLPATLYQKTADGKIAPVPNEKGLTALGVGTKVEVVGKFDSSSKYTQIKYYLEGAGTVTYYVETANLRYDGTNIVTVVATVVIMLTLILGIVLLLRFMHNNKKAKKN